MSKKNSEWEELEKMVADIQKQLAPDATVLHNHHVMGKSGRKRKLDVTISQRISSFPIFIIFDCKHHSKPVTLKDTAAFSVQIEDVGATLGVMVSSSGFDAGARAIAKDKRIILQTFRKAGKTDWNNLLGENAWSILTGVQLSRVSATAVLIGNSDSVDISFETPILDENEGVLENLSKVFWDTWNEMGKPIGDVNGQVSFEGFPSYIKWNGILTQIQNVTVNAKLIAKKHLVNLRMADGKVIEEENNPKPVYRSVISEGFDWAEILRSQPGVEINNEEYQQILRGANLAVDLSKAKRYIRIVAEEKGKPTQATM